MFRTSDAASLMEADPRSRIFDWAEVEGEATEAPKRPAHMPEVKSEAVVYPVPGRLRRDPRAVRRVFRSALWAIVVGLGAAWMMGAIMSRQSGGAHAGVIGSAVTDAQTEALGPLKPASEVVYVVQPGDTLWSIARRLDPAGDERPMVDRLASRLHGASIYPGEVIQIP